MRRNWIYFLPHNEVGVDKNAGLGFYPCYVGWNLIASQHSSRVFFVRGFGCALFILYGNLKWALPRSSEPQDELKSLLNSRLPMNWKLTALRLLIMKTERENRSFIISARYVSCWSWHMMIFLRNKSLDFSKNFLKRTSEKALYITNISSVSDI